MTIAMSTLVKSYLLYVRFHRCTESCLFRSPTVGFWVAAWREI